MSESLRARCLAIDFASDLAEEEPDPRKWEPYLVLLLHRLEKEANYTSRPEALQVVFSSMRDELNARLDTIR
jgi:hypothetical protein